MAAPLFDTKTSGTGAASAGGTITISHAGGSLDNRYALVGVAFYNKTRTITDVTYDGVAMAALGTADSQFEAGLVVYGLKNCAAGTKNVVVTYGTSSEAAPVVATVLTYSGVDLTTPNHNYGSAKGTSTAPSVTIVSATGELVVAFVTAVGATRTIAVNGAQTERENSVYTNNGNTSIYGAAELAGAASTVMAWTITGASTHWVDMGVALYPVAASGGGVIPVGWNSGMSGGMKALSGGMS
jgi:hypothetical protein